ncbi:MAG TPA: hypothetical protein VMY37_37635 [Thermoguttaceae bacterium]|nr:hypothetical protein [Thermoguttaceae bacterium]
MRPTRFVRTSSLVLSAAVLGAVLVEWTGASSLYAQDPFGQLVGRIPRSANFVVILNVEKALGSPLGVREGWKENLQKAFDAGMMRVPPKANRFVLASQIDFQFMEPIWEAAVMEAGETISVEQIAVKHKGTLDKIFDVDAVALPRDVYLVRFAPRTFGAMAPANRQAVWRWLYDLRSKKPLSPYLQQAAVYSDEAGTEIIMAVDLEGVVGVQQAQNYLNAAELPSEAKKNVASLAQLLSGVRGVRLGIRLGSETFGKLAVDFRDEVSISPELAKTLFLGILANAGMSLADLESWQPAVSGKEASLQGKLSTDGLRRVLSVVESPSADVSEGKPTAEAPSPDDPKQIMAVKSLEHFRSAVTLLEDIKKDMKGNLANLSSMSLWFDKYAKKIERLPILNVDEDLLEYSTYAARQLRNASLAVRGMGVRSAVRQSDITSGDGAGYAYAGGYRYGRYGAYGGGVAVYNPRAEARAVGSERRKVRYEERGAMAGNVQMIRDEIIQATTDVRRLMTQRYEVEF